MQQATQISVSEAIGEAPAHAVALAAMAAEHRARHTAVDQCQTIRSWQTGARTYCYQTHIAISAQPSTRLAWLGQVLYRAATLTAQPWYPQFQGGSSQSLDSAPAAGVSAHQLSRGCFDLGLPAPRYYRQLISLARPDTHTAVVVARSTLDGPPLPEAASLAFTLSPNGEVLHWQNGHLHWHHICCTPGAALLPATLDRWLINGLRRLGLDTAERSTYRQEAEQMRDWLQSAAPEQDLDITLVGGE